MFELKIILLYFFWLSFFVIGLAFCIVLEHFKKAKSFVDYIRNNHPLVIYCILTSIGLACFIPFITLAMWLEISLWVIKVVYVLIVMTSLSVCVWKRHMLIAKLRFKPTNLRLSFEGIFYCSVLSIVGFSAFKVGGYISGDATIFISMIRQFIAKGSFTFADPYFGWNGVMNIGYSINLANALRALGSSLIGLTPLEVWQYSNLFFLILFFVSVFCLFYNFLPKKYLSWSFIIASTVPLAFRSLLLYESLPSRICLIWTVLFFIGIKRLLEGKGYFVLILASLLLASTHSLHATFAGVFLITLVFFLFVTKQLSKHILIVSVVAMPILFAPITLALRIPRFIPPAEFVPVIQKLNMGLRLAIPLDLYFVWSRVFILIGLIVLFLFLHKLVKNIRLLRIGYVIIGLGLIFDYNNKIFSLLGFLALLILNESKKIRVFIVAVFLFTTLTAYNPLLTDFLLKVLPAWAISRIADFNIFHFFAPVLGALFLIHYARQKLPKNMLNDSIYLLVIGMYFTYIPYLSATFNPLTNLGHTVAQQESFAQDLVQLQTIKQEINNKILYTNDRDLVRLIPNIAIVNVVATPTGGPSPLANVFLRRQCFEALEERLDYNDLLAAKVDSIIASTKYDSKFDELARTKTYLRLTKQSGDLKVYDFIKDNKLEGSQLVKSSSCNIPWRQ